MGLAFRLEKPLARRWGWSAWVLVMMGSLQAPRAIAQQDHDSPPAFRRIASFEVFRNTDVTEETVAEIVAASEDGRTLIYTDSTTENVGFVDINIPSQPQPAGVLPVGGEPTSVAVVGRYALVAVDTSADFVNTSGVLHVVNIGTQSIVRTIDLGGQPDCVAISPDGDYACVVIENERDEDLGDGRPVQLPAGFLVVIDLRKSSPSKWSSRVVHLVGIADLYPEDPEPEYAHINQDNVAIVSLQENNHLVLVDLKKARVIGDFPAGAVDLQNIDTEENDLIDQTASQIGRLREPDAVAWTSDLTFATANEGDLDGGSRGFTIFSKWGWPLYESESTVEQIVARAGHYPEDRSENKGNEPEGVAFAKYGRWPFFQSNLLFVGSERSSAVLVYQLPGLIPQLFGVRPRLLQVLPAGVGPEGLLPIPQRNLLVVASETDARSDKIRSVISIYSRSFDSPNYPQIVSADRANGLPIPWAALSGLSVDPTNPHIVYSVYDSYYQRSRIFRMNVATRPALIESEIELRDPSGVLQGALEALVASLSDPGNFDPADIVNGDGTVNLDPEGIFARPEGGFWVASEGGGNLTGGVSNPGNQPFLSPNLLIQADATGAIVQVVQLPIELTENQLRFGFEGVTAVTENGQEVLYVAFQREWTAAGDPARHVRIGRFDTASGEWTFAYYPIDPRQSPNGGWVGLSELTWLGGTEFAVIERDDQAGADARIKWVTTFSIDGVEFQPNSEAPNFPVVSKALVRDLIADGDYAATGGYVLEKIEGLAVLADGTVLVVNDNDGVEDSNGETQLFRFWLD